MTQARHNWILSTVGHGELQCSRCLVTNKEANALLSHTCDDVTGKWPETTLEERVEARLKEVCDSHKQGK